MIRVDELITGILESAKAEEIKEKSNRYIRYAQYLIRTFRLEDKIDAHAIGEQWEAANPYDRIEAGDSFINLIEPEPRQIYICDRATAKFVHGHNSSFTSLQFARTSCKKIFQK